MTQHTKYQNKNPIHQFFLRRFLSHIDSAVTRSGANTILDLASAQGYVINALHTRHPELSFHGVDIDEEALEEAKQLSFATFEKGDIYTYSYNKPVDLVMALEVLEHLDDVPRALQNISRIDSEHVLFSVPHEPYFRTMNFLRGRHVARLGNHPEHVNLWTARAFRKEIEPYFMIIGDYSSFPWTVFLTKRKTS